MLIPPTDLDLDDLRAALAAGWGITPTVLAYRPVGFGSHHWEACGADGARWFVTLDDVQADLPFRTLRAALGTAGALPSAGLDFVVAPRPMHSGEVLWLLSSRYAVSVYPFIEGTAFEWDGWAGAEHRTAVLDMVADLHQATAGAADVVVEDLSIPGRAGLEAALLGDVDRRTGPFADEATALVAATASQLQQALEHYDQLTARCGARNDDWVLTHGEPHPGNTMRAGTRWLLIDWGTLRWAPPERDLWLVDAGDGALLRRYADRTGVVARPALLQLFRLRWDLFDITVELGRFQRFHTGTQEDVVALAILRSGLAALRR